MYRATTPVHTFIFKENPQDFAKILITYAQNNQIILEKTKDDLIFDSYTPTESDTVVYTATLQLTQEETRKFTIKSGSPSIQVQVRVLDDVGNAWASDKKRVPLKDVFNDSIL